MYVDNLVLVVQARTFTELEGTLNDDLITIQKYIRKYHLKLYPSKLVTKVFQLNNLEAKRIKHTNRWGKYGHRRMLKIPRSEIRYYLNIQPTTKASEK